MLMRVYKATFYFVTKTRKNNSSGYYVLHLVLYNLYALFIVRTYVTRMPKSSCTLKQNQELKRWEYFEKRNMEVQGWGLPPV